MSQESSKSNSVLVIIAIIGVLGTIIGGIINIYGNMNVEKFRQEAELTKIALVSIATQGGATQMVLQNTVDAPTPLPYPTYTPQQAIVITATPPALTPTPTALPIQSSGFVFEDDFENGLDPNWNIKYGELGMANGKLTIISPFSKQHSNYLAVLDNHYWGNYKVTFEIAPFEDTGAFESDNGQVAILLRYKEGQDNVGFYISGSIVGVQFGKYTKNKEWELYASSLVTGREGDFNFYPNPLNPSTITIECIGNTYTAYINDKKINSFNVPGTEQGQIGFWFLNGTFAESRKDGVAARIEYIVIEALE